ncbi:XP_029643366.2uncharacterized protein LOC115217825 isoform X1 [Octopus vulgaris]|uniref:XP_029643366.2uncharacterized protein LOC115217825 isoform X1 n=2 Tax=Octopus TaxID=6643 RepID=A0AA36BAN1_OCTVU|nr:uncharacterized protein LOC115217825 isoform X1 [Octopus sinensis]CAI9730921.1 XP_029643366.2uncharacterized protein LOC115217825 isoform X1 [Octopus vulgaris]
MSGIHVTRLEISPLVALLNMIKNNYFEKPEVFRTLVAVLHDYNHCLNSAKKVVKYIQLLLSDNNDLAHCLLSLLPKKPIACDQSFNSICNVNPYSGVSSVVLQGFNDSSSVLLTNSYPHSKPAIIICHNCYSPIMFNTH